MVAWVLRFGLFGLGNPGSGVWMFILSMLVYGVAFDFFNVSGSLFVDRETDISIRSSAQGLFIIMTNGIRCDGGYVERTGGGEPFCGLQQYGTAGGRMEPGVVYLCGVCAGGGSGVCPRLPLQTYA